MSKINQPASDDWRRQGQEEYLTGVALIHQQYRPYRAGWDHDHCEFCGSKFSLQDGNLIEGYTTQDQYRWICIPCFNDFKNEFGWLV